MRSLLSAVCILGSASSLFAQNTSSLIIQNPSAFERKEVISIPFENFKKHFELKDSIFSIIDQGSKKPLIYQLEKKRKINTSKCIDCCIYCC